MHDENDNVPETPADSSALDTDHGYYGIWDHTPIDPPCTVFRYVPNTEKKYPFEPAPFESWTLPLKSLRIHPLTSSLVAISNILSAGPGGRYDSACDVAPSEYIVPQSVDFQQVLDGRWRFSVLRTETAKKPEQLYVLWFEPAATPPCKSHVPQAHFYLETISRLCITESSSKEVVLQINFNRCRQDQAMISCFGPMDKDDWISGNDKACLDFILDPVWNTDVMECVLDLDYPGCAPMIDQFVTEIGGRPEAIHGETFKGFNNITYTSCLTYPSPNDGMMLLTFPTRSVLTEERRSAMGEWPTFPSLEVPAQEPEGKCKKVDSLSDEEDDLAMRWKVRELDISREICADLQQNIADLNQDIIKLREKVHRLEREVEREGEGEVKPEGEVEAEPEGEVEAKPEEEGEVKPEVEGEVQA